MQKCVPSPLSDPSLASSSLACTVTAADARGQPGPVRERAEHREAGLGDVLPQGRGHDRAGAVACAGHGGARKAVRAPQPLYTADYRPQGTCALPRLRLCACVADVSCVRKDDSGPGGRAGGRGAQGRHHALGCDIRMYLSDPSFFDVAETWFPLAGGTDAHWQQEDIPPRGVGRQGHEPVQGLSLLLTRHVVHSLLTLRATALLLRYRHGRLRRMSTTRKLTLVRACMPSSFALYTHRCHKSVAVRLVFVFLYQGIRCIVVEFFSMCA